MAVHALQETCTKLDASMKAVNKQAGTRRQLWHALRKLLLPRQVG
jgi:hypothetical protein